MFFPKRYNYIVAEDPASYATPSIEPEHIFSSRKDIVEARKKLLKQWIFTILQLWIVTFLISTLYLGSGHNPNRYTTNLDVAIVNFDGGQAGNYFLNGFEQSPPGNYTLHWRYKSPSDFDNNIDNTQNYVEGGKVWAIVSLLPNTTLLINQTLSAFINATTALISPFISTPNIIVQYESGRNAFTINNFVLPAIRAAIETANTQYGQVLRTELINELYSSSTSSNNRNEQLVNTFQLGSLLVNPFSAHYQDLHPGSPYVGQLATTLGYIYIYLISGMIVGATISFISPFVGTIHWFDLIVFRVTNGLFQAFIISLIYSLIVLWLFGIHSGSLFMRYWMFNWLAAMIFGIIFALFTVNLGVIANSALTVFAILMLAGATIQISLELAPRFYRYGYGLPLYNIINGGRHLLFNSHSRFALNVGVLLIYFFAFWITAIILSILQMKRSERKKAKENEKTKTKKNGDSTAIIARH